MRRRTGFTLIELLVVVAIIAILAAILFPVFLRAKQRSQMAACQSNMKQLASAMIMYAGDWNGYMVMSARGPTWASESEFVFWGSAIKKYCSAKKEVNYCPYAPPVFDAVGAGGMEWRYYWGTSIGMNVALGHQANGTMKPDDPTFIPPARIDSDIRAPSRTIMLGDSSLYSKAYADSWQDWCSEHGCTPSRLGHWAICPPGRSVLGSDTRLKLNPWPQGWPEDFFDPDRHGGLVNIACVDGHVVAKQREWLLSPHDTNKRAPDYTWWDQR
jgi:prepilin-type N-terminal cleavage/methylation domain-containing protein/prepilin-type processing-associated H-X9-DG protein